MAKDINKVKIKDIKKLNYNDIIKDDNVLLRDISKDVSLPLSKDNKIIMNQMIEYVRASQNPTIAKERKLRPAYGISAIQIGHKKKMMFIRIENEFGGEPEEFALINPRIVSKSENQAYLENGEGCLSVLDEHLGYVHRSYTIKMSAVDYFTNREIEIESKGLTAIVFQHEMDHLLGIMFYDRINKLNPYNVIPKSIKIS